MRTTDLQTTGTILPCLTTAGYSTTSQMPNEMFLFVLQCVIHSSLLHAGSCELLLPGVGRGSPGMESRHEHMSWTQVSHTALRLHKPPLNHQLPTCQLELQNCCCLCKLLIVIDHKLVFVKHVLVLSYCFVIHWYPDPLPHPTDTTTPLLA